MKKSKIIIIGILLTIFLIPLFGSRKTTPVGDEVIVAGRCLKYVNNYNQFYSSKKETVIKGFMNSGPGSAYKIYLLPDKKVELLNKIKEDVNLELKNLIDSNKNVLKAYKISDDFRKVSIYYYKDAPYYDIQYQAQQNTIAPEIEFYAEIANGYFNTSFKEEIVTFIETD